ncbi:uncharacterized protein LOC127732475 [Mytilus californianus]|uniref:uncharacterized protein LOC127732475 n=1 Tax=Mytilus californianus TaxID=6549 RepID=UPI00224550C9|nr:uncharacterized protein LOC127732475 [Mytilus californianus]
MKKDSEVRGMDSLCERFESSRCDSFNSSAGSDAESSQRPRIEEFLSRRWLGQHAGELLLDLHAFVNPTEMTTLSFPGIIVNKTEVILTLLEISRDHLQKLESDTDKLLDQRGTIFYSKPFDIMDCEDRSVLIDSLIRLNNIENQINK